MGRRIVKTEDLGQDWYATLYADGGITLRNPNIGQRVDLTAANVARLRTLIPLIDAVRAVDKAGA